MLLSLIACGAWTLAAAPAVAQISFTTAIDLALKNNPKVLAAEAAAAKAQAALQGSKDVYIPSLVGGSGLGYSYGFPVGQPSIFNFTSQSLLFNFSQRDYVRAARAALDAANLALKDAREAVAEDTAITYIALDRDTAREAALDDQSGYAKHLVEIVQERLDAGQDTAIGLTMARLTAARIRLAKLHAGDDAETDLEHLAHLTGLPARGLSIVGSSIPVIAAPVDPTSAQASSTSPAVDAAYATAHAKSLIAFGDARYLWRPQIFFAAQYNRYTKYNNYDLYYKNFQHNNAGIGVEIQLPIFDAARRAKARESAADAVRAQYEADEARDQFLEGRKKLEHTTAELAAQAEVATLDQQLAQQQLDAMLVQLKSGTGNPNGPQMTPKDAELSRIAEREKFLAVLDAKFQMRQAEINLMRQTGELETWLKSVAAAQASVPASD
ncbi:TolC family protein [Edaphobacter sp.]|uniref:TolC family protein n=1 Tax=Edaphobacter sp. TaxID=1934404 RepID=UPI002DBD8196|nr:TolC family protein [Edaphobacter sp.]HEU5341390.1 TolC family protein [Edaphobacter sp.]